MPPACSTARPRPTSTATASPTSPPSGPTRDITPGAAQWFILPSQAQPAASRRPTAPSPSSSAPPGASTCRRRSTSTATAGPTSPPSGRSATCAPGAAQWFILPSGPNDADVLEQAGGFPVTFGAAGNADQPAVADYNGDGRDDITAFRSVTDLPGGEPWFILPSSGASPASAAASRSPSAPPATSPRSPTTTATACRTWRSSTARRHLDDPQRDVRPATCRR